jgi:5-methylcytosine-specific restriction endonuclease McrA
MFPRKTCVTTESLTRVLTFITPKLQRNLCTDHVRHMVNDQRNEYNANQCYSMLQSITVASLNNELYLLDGQHRMKAFSQLAAEGYPIEDVIIPVVIYYVKDLNELASYYNRINKNKPIHPLELVDTWDVYEKPFLESMSSTFKNYLKETGNGGTCRCPHICMNELKRSLQARLFGTKLEQGGVSASKLWTCILSLNKYVKEHIKSELQLCPTMRKRLEECEVKSTKNKCEPCFLGIWRRFEWLDICMTVVANGDLHFTNIDMSSFTVSRRKIPFMIRQQTWKKVNDVTHANGHCFVCEADISFHDMECGHIVAHALGGGDTLENLMPVCKTCNRDMAIMNMYDYKRLVNAMVS